MKYRTTCPSCASVFRLVEDQLAAAGGWVQCSVCGTAFDARASLLLENGSPLPRPEPVQSPSTEPAPVEEPAVISAPEKAPSPAEPISAPPVSDEAGTEEPALDLPRGIAERESGLDLDSIILIDPEIPVSDDPGPLPHIYPPAQPRPRARAAEAKPAAPPANPGEKSSAAAPQPTPAAPPARKPLAQPPAWLWMAASALLLVALAGQLTYFLRDTLASRLPPARPALEHMCEAFGCRVSLPKNLALLQIVGSDLHTEAPGRLRLTLTLGNRAQHAQAWPVLLLTLTDQRGRPLARRSFAPSEYLADDRRRADGIPARSEQDLSLPLAVRDLAPMGFDLQLRY